MITYKEFWEMDHQARVKLFKGMSTSIVLVYMMNIIDTADHFTEHQKSRGKKIIMDSYKSLAKIKNPLVRAEYAFSMMISSCNRLVSEIGYLNGDVRPQKRKLKVVK